MSHKVCTRCQFVVPTKKKLCTTCGSKKFHVFADQPEVRTASSPAAADFGAAIECNMIPALSAVSISSTNTPAMSTANATRSVTGLREKFIAVDEDLSTLPLKDVWSKLAKAFSK